MRSASSGVITPLARPRMPSVPKYLRTIVFLFGPAPQLGARPYYGDHYSNWVKNRKQPLFPDSRRFVKTAAGPEVGGYDKFICIFNSLRDILATDGSCPFCSARAG